MSPEGLTGWATDWGTTVDPGKLAHGTLAGGIIGAVPRWWPVAILDGGRQVFAG